MTVTVIGTAGPAGRVAGTFVMVTKPSAAVTELTVIVPPPVFWRPRGLGKRRALEVWAEKESRLLVTVSCAGAGATFRETLMVWLLPAQGLGGMQVTRTEVCSEPAGEQERARIEHDADGARRRAAAGYVEPGRGGRHLDRVTERLQATLDCTGMLAPAGRPVAPALSAKRAKSGTESDRRAPARSRSDTKRWR